MTGAAEARADFGDRRKPTVGDERRRAILQALEHLLRERPLAEINVADIASAAGVGRSGFYFYFASKGAAVAATLGDVFTEMLSQSIDALRNESDPVAAVRAGLKSTWASWQAHEGLILAMLDAQGNDPAVREVWNGWLDGFVEPLTAEIDRVGDPPPDGQSTRDLVETLIGANERAFERLSRSNAEAARVTETITALTHLWSSLMHRSTP